MSNSKKLDPETWSGQSELRSQLWNGIFDSFTEDKGSVQPVSTEERVLANARRYYFLIEKLYREEYKRAPKAMLVWSHIRFSRELVIELRTRLPNWKSGPLLQPLPNWCLVYLASIAYATHALALGRDPRKQPLSSDEDCIWATWWETEALTPKQRLSALPEVFGFARQGYNAFLEHDENKFTDDLLLFVDLPAPDWPKTKTARINKIVEALGHSDDRALRRRLGRRRQEKGDPWKGVKPPAED